MMVCVALRHFQNEVLRQRHARGFPHLRLRRQAAAITDVVVDRVVKKNRLLGDDADLGAQGIEFDVANVVAVDGDAPLGNVEEARNQAGQGGLAGPAGAHQRHHLALANMQVDVAQQGDPVLVVELHLFEGNLLLEGRQTDGPGFVHHFRFGVQVMEHLFGGAEGLLVRVADARQPLHRFVGFQQRVKGSR